MTRVDGPSGMQLLVRPQRAEASLWRRLRFEADGECREQLFNLYVGLARAIAWRSFRRRATARLERLDFEQFAFEGLLQAIDRYDPVRGVPFRAFAARRIAGNIADGIARMSEVDAQLSHRRRIEQERLRSLARESDGDPSDDALAALSDLAAGLAIGLMLEGTGLMDGEDGADPAPNPYERLEWRELKARVASGVAALPAREALVIRHHYDTGLSFARIAEMLDLSRGRVSQLHRSALTKLRKKVGGFR